MSISRFKFVSPGVYVKEIDKSQTAVPAPVMGPTIIGRSVKGPMMRPVRVDSYADFVEVFGEPHPGGYNGDVWRAGITLGPTYGSYAAKAYLAVNGPVTFVRLAGYQHSTAENDDARAGWKLKNSPSTSSPSSNGGAYGLFIAPITSSGNQNVWTMPESTASLAAIFYANEGTVGLIGRPLSGTTTLTNSAGTWVRASSAGSSVVSSTFNLLISGSGKTSDIKFNFDKTSKNFIRNKFNTNPTSLRDDINSEDAIKNYFLGESFETFLENNVSANSISGSYAATVVALKSGSVGGDYFKFQAQTSHTGWITGQHKGVSSSFAPDSSGLFPVQNLFRFHSLSEGEWNQNNIKISISDIKPSPNRFEKYGTFTVSIRKMNDNDVNQAPVEVYSNLNLNPLSTNYIAKRIGDIYMEWNEDRKLFEEKGMYRNNSKYIRVEMHPLVDQGGTEQDLLPFGFYGPPKFKSVVVSGSSAEDSVISTDSFITTQFYNAAYNAGTSKISGNSPYTASLTFPEPSYVVSSSKDSVATNIEQVYWGIKTKESNSKIFDPSLVDILRVKPGNLSENSQALTYSTFFSLDDIAFSGSAPGTVVTESVKLNSASWKSGNRLNGLSVTSESTFNDEGSINGIGGTRFQRLARFTLPLYGGFNGFDITEKEPFSEGNTHSLNDGAIAETSYAYNSIKVAIESVSDPEVVETNLMVIPGIQNESLTNRLIETCEQRGDALAIVDIKNDFKSSFEGKKEVAPNVDQAIIAMKSRNMNSSYGCCFFPAVLARDNSAGAILGMPSSVVALGVMASSEVKSELWFAPAGFNRGGLSTGAAGFPVIGVKSKLTSKDRDNLYEVNINPIASFPSEGIVVFGQKTLQATPSALDRINVRRLMIYVKKEISRMANTVLFDQNVQVTWARFTNLANPFLASIQQRFGLTDYRITLDQTTTTPELVDRNIVYAKIFLKPARAIEFIALDFILTNSGASFDD